MQTSKDKVTRAKVRVQVKEESMSDCLALFFIRLPVSASFSFRVKASDRVKVESKCY